MLYKKLYYDQSEKSQERWFYSWNTLQRY